jgi:hypothetical protein
MNIYHFIRAYPSFLIRLKRYYNRSKLIGLSLTQEFFAHAEREYLEGFVDALYFSGAITFDEIRLIRNYIKRVDTFAKTAVKLTERSL